MTLERIFTMVLLLTVQMSASAESTEKRQANNPDVSQQAVREHSMFRPTVDEAKATRREFELDDGRSLKISSERRTLYVELDGKVAELVPVAANTFVTRDGSTRIAFDRIPWPSEVTVESLAP